MSIEITTTTQAIKDGILDALGTKAYTQTEKTKLASLEDSKFKGLYTSYASLTGSYPTGAAGYYANVDSGVGNDVVRYIWDVDDTGWVLQLGVSTAETPASIKTKYESNPDTNAFTDAYLLKLSGIEDNATADQTDAEIETAYNNQVIQVTTGEKYFGVQAAIRRFSPTDISDMVGYRGSGHFYPLTNPSGYITGFSSGDYVLKTATGSAATKNSGDFVDVYNAQNVSGEKTFVSSGLFKTGMSVSGFFGLGTSNPTAPFHLAGQFGATTMSGGHVLSFFRNAGNYIQAPNVGGFLSLAAGGTSNSYSMNLNNGNLTIGSAQNNDGYKLSVNGDGRFTTSLNVGTNLTVTGSGLFTGKLGINTSAPIGLVHTREFNGNGTTGLLIENTFGEANKKISFRGGGTTTEVGYINTWGYTNAGFPTRMEFGVYNPLTTTTENVLTFKTGKAGFGLSSPSYHVDVTGDGRFGTNLTIGNTLTVTGNTYITGNLGVGVSPSYKLDVNGNGNFSTSLNVGTNCTIGGHLSAATKSFLIPHRTKEGKKLQYGVIESNQHSVLVRGTTDQKVINLPDEWQWLVDEESVTVHLTPVGKFRKLFVESQDNKVVVVGGVKGSYNYTIYGERKDVAKLETEV